jgi:hypothetical protein
MTTAYNNRLLLACFMLGVSMLLVVQGPAGTGAFFGDIETTTGNVFQAGVWVDPQSPFNIVLNEFLPNPDDTANGLNFGDDSSDKPLGEWVEIYNKGNAPLNLTGWYLSDASGGLGNQQAIITAANTNLGTTTIPAQGWLVVYFNKAVLNNTGDSLFLYTNTNVLVDSYTYDDPSDFCELELTPGSTNATSTTSGVPGTNCITNQVAPNKSYARIPDGTGAFVDPIPTPGAPNVLETEQSPRGSTSLDAEEELVVEIGEPIVETTITEENPIVEEEPIVEISEPVVPTFGEVGGPTPTPESEQVGSVGLEKESPLEEVPPVEETVSEPLNDLQSESSGEQPPEEAVIAEPEPAPAPEVTAPVPPPADESQSSPQP